MRLKRIIFGICIIFVSLMLVTCVSPQQPAVPTPAPVPPAPSAAQSPVAVPPLPELKDVTVSPKNTALLVLDIQKQSCTPERRPSCVASIPKVKALLDQARSRKMLVVYSLTRNAQVTDIVPELAALGTEPVVVSGPDKFIGTELENILKQNSITQVIVTGTVAHGAALHTAMGAAFRGFQVVVPVDGMSADPFPEYYTTWHLANAPGTSGVVTLSRSDKIKIE
jgi:nicotinamidase-related amidase